MPRQRRGDKRKLIRREVKVRRQGWMREMRVAAEDEAQRRRKRRDAIKGKIMVGVKASPVPSR